MAADSRAMLLQTAGCGRGNTLPWILRTQAAIENLIGIQRKENVREAIQFLALLGSESSSVINILQKIRGIAVEAPAKFRGNHGAQINLISVPRRQRPGYDFHGVLGPTRRPNGISGEIFSRGDNFNHLIKCYNLQHLMRRGPDAMDFMVTPARRPLPWRQRNLSSTRIIK